MIRVRSPAAPNAIRHSGVEVDVERSATRTVGGVAADKGKAAP